MLDRLAWVVVGAGAAAVALRVAARMARPSPYSASPLGLRDQTAEAPVELEPEEAVPPVSSFWSRDRIVEHRAQVGQFVRRIMYIDDEAFFLHDEMTLEDLYPGSDLDQYVRRTREKYGVDISDIRPPYLWAIAKRIHDGPIEPSVRPLRDSILADSYERLDAYAEDAR